MAFGQMSDVLVACLSMLGTLVGTFAGIITSTKLSNYRIEQLEKKVEKHNSVVERTSILEKEIKTVWRNIGEIKEEVDDNHREINNTKHEMLTLHKNH